ncbi:protein JINGUBANG-like [Rhodamnia argentea]|uniref:Protein JINGUBANG-like n=1 Tax=Rhodamnia argentea TaxID=178133 RepID=A0A8B8NGK6_9MYRT|nr:protein JINGUBANG-like [Rhodamnia argentea]
MQSLPHDDDDRRHSIGNNPKPCRDDETEPLPWRSLSRSCPRNPDDHCHHSLIATVRCRYANSYVSSLAVAGKFLLAGSSDRDILSWERTALANSDNTRSGGDGGLWVVAECAGTVKSLVVVSDKLFSAHQDHKIRAWRIRAQDLNQNHPNHLKYSRLATMPTLGDRVLGLLVPEKQVQFRRHRRCAWASHADVVSGLALSRDASLLYSVSWDRSIKIWHTSDFRCLESVRDAHDDAINAVASSGDGRVYTGSADKKIKVWQKLEGDKNHSLVATLEGHGSGVNALALNSDGSILFSGGRDRSIMAWEKEDGGDRMVVVCVLLGHSKSILCLKVVSDLVLSGSADKTIRIWRGSEKSYACVSVLNGHRGPVKCLTAAADCGSSSSACFVVYSGSLDCDLKVWKVAFPIL